MSITDPFIGSQLGDYKIVDLLGRGGMARVYRGYDPRLNRYAAVKVIDAALLSGGEDEYRGRFLREARAIAGLDHPNIVSVYQFGEYENLYYMAMKFIEGRDLSLILKETGGALLTNAQTLRIITDIGSALDYAHKAGVIHRDVKPSNIMVMKDGHAVLTDFGLALSVPEGSMGTTFGSAHYIAPEQAISSAQAVAQSDLYSLGVVMYQMLTGRVPFDDPSAMTVALKHLSDPPPPPRTFNPNISHDVERVVLRALEKDIDDRYPTGEQMARALEAALGLAPATDPYLPPLAFTAREFDVSSKTQGFPPDDSSRAAAVRPLRTSEARRITDSAAGRPAPLTEPKFPTASTAALDRVATGEQARARITPTLVDPPAQPPRRSRLPLLLVGLLIIIGLAAAAFAASGGFGGTGDSTTAIAAAETPGQTLALIGAAVTASDEPTVAQTEAAETPTSIPSETPTPRPTRTPSATPTATRTPPVVRTATLTHTATPPPSATPTRTLISAGDRAVVQLIYDDESFILRNASARPVNISGWQFVQVLTVGERTFFANNWEGGSRPVWALPAGDCFQLWDILTTDQLPIPESCGARHAWRAIAPQRQFWVSPTNSDTATFEVRDEDGVVLERCRISAGECLVSLPT